MSPYEHFFWNYAIAYRKPWAWKVGLGGVVPDLIYFIAFIPKLPFYQSFHEWMMDPLWDKVWDSWMAKSAHSIAILGMVGLSMVVLIRITDKKRLVWVVYPFLLGWALHIVADALTHVSDGYAIFFPFSSYRFPAPVSYWEAEFHGRVFFWVSHSLMAGLLLIWGGLKIAKVFNLRRA